MASRLEEQERRRQQRIEDERAVQAKAAELRQSQLMGDMAYGAAGFRAEPVSENGPFDRFSVGEHAAIKYACQDIIDNFTKKTYAERFNVLFDLLHAKDRP